MFVTLLSLVSIAFFLFKFFTNDGDFTLVSKKQAKREEIEDKVVWITGASRGIGEALAKQCATLGAKVIISARNETELHGIKQEFTGYIQHKCFWDDYSHSTASTFYAEAL